MLEGFCRKSLRRIDLLERGVLKGFRCAQAHNGLGLDLDRFACGRIAPHACFAVSLHCAADSWNYEFAGAARFLYGKLEQLVEESDDLFLGDRLFVGADLLRHVRNNLGLAHRICHRIYVFLLKCNCLDLPVDRDALRTIAAVVNERKRKVEKSPVKWPFPQHPILWPKLFRSEPFVEKRNCLDPAKIIFQRDVFVGRVRILVRQTEAQQHAGDFESIVHLGDERN
jgi:hypothetical protein